LLARARAVMRRISEKEDLQATTIRADGMCIDLAKRKVEFNGNEVHLTPKEYDLLCYMARNPDRVLTHRQLLTKIWGQEYADDSHTLRVHVANLRTKIEEQPERPRYIHTETRVGYRFRPDALPINPQAPSVDSSLS